MSDIYPDPFKHLRAAAAGNLEAMRSIVWIGMERLRDEPDIIAIAEALVFARIAAAAGDPADTGMLLFLIRVVVDLLTDQEPWSAYREQLQGEIIALTTRLADAGDDTADARLPRMVQEVSPRASAIARDIHARMSAM